MAIERVDMGSKSDKPRRPPPDRFCVEKGSDWNRKLDGCIRIAIDGVERFGEVVEYCISGRWARVHVLVNGKPVANMLNTGWRNRRLDGCRVTVWWADQPVPPDVHQHA